MLLVLFPPQGHVIMNTQTTSLYQRVIDKTKTLAFQSQFVAQNIDKKKAAEALALAGGVSVLHVIVLVFK